MTQKVLVVGGDSNVGKALCKTFCGGHLSVPYVVRTTRGEVLHSDQIHLDLLNPNLPTDMTYDVIYLVAAITGIMACEKDPESWRVNADGPAQLALQATDARFDLGKMPAHVVFISSDAVESAPRLAYSLQKAYAETVVLSLGGTVVRPARILPERIDNLVELLIDVGLNRKSGLHRWEG